MILTQWTGNHQMADEKMLKDDFSTFVTTVVSGSFLPNTGS